jgi:Flp pilus assembly protein CpaB
VRALRSLSLTAGPVRRLRLFVARRPLVYWLLVASVAALTAAFILDRTAAADAARHRWGTQRTIVVATVDLAPGQALGADDTRTEAWPLALVPDDALRSIPAGVVVAEPIAAGEPLRRRRIGRADVGPVAALLPAGTRGVTLPAGDTLPPVVPGDRVDLVAAGLALDSTLVASDALVLVVDERSVVVAVDATELAVVAGALVNATVVLAVTGDPPAGG